MEEDFIIRTHREGTVETTTDIENTFNTMGCSVMNTRLLGAVTIVVERIGGINTKERINWAADNNPKFDSLLDADAKTLLSQAIKAVEGGGDNGDLRLKFVGKR
jgi:hypothetical protein